MGGDTPWFSVNNAVTPDGNTTRIGYCFPPLVVVGHIVQPMTECRAPTVIVLPDVHERWFPITRARARTDKGR